uniref:LTD domain-containing protein n=1 Tax=Romanomermis culicivorax TaxID=13658 RepID=A0A915L0H6_ROMCU
MCHNREKELYVEEVDQNLETIYSNKLHEHLLEMRRELEDIIGANRRQIEENYNSKLENLHSSAECHYQTELDFKKQMQILKLKLENYDSTKLNAESKLIEFQREIENLTSKLSKSKQDYDFRLQNSQKMIEKLQNQLNEMLNNYETLMGSKIQICKEIEQFQKMLEGEEKRLCLSPLVEQTGTASKRKIVKAKRLLDPNFEYQFNILSSKLIKIVEIDRNGKFLKILNDSNDVDFPIGGWTLECKADNQEPVVYKFHQKLSLKAGKSCT